MYNKAIVNQSTCCTSTINSQQQSYLSSKYPQMQSFIGQSIAHSSLTFNPRIHRWVIASIAVDEVNGIAYATAARCSMTNEFRTLTPPLAVEHGAHLKKQTQA